MRGSCAVYCCQSVNSTVRQFDSSTALDSSTDSPSGGGAEYLRQLDKEPRPRGIFIDDPKGLFIFRWYKEVKADGSPVGGRRYQNPQCAFYQLTLDNDGDPFVYTSNVQLISKVFLNKTSNLSRCYSLNKKDKKMVEEGMKKMVEPEAQAAV